MATTLPDWLAELGSQKARSELGTAVYLLLWLRRDETHRRSPVTYRWMAQRSGFNERTIERWLRTLREAGWVRVDAAWNGLHIRVRSRFAAGPAQDSDFERIETRGWQRAPLAASDEMEADGWAHRGRDRREPGALELTNAYADSDPAFVVEDARGGRRSEFLHDSDPPMERRNAARGD